MAKHSLLLIFFKSWPLQPHSGGFGNILVLLSFWIFWTTNLNRPLSACQKSFPATKTPTSWNTDNASRWVRQIRGTTPPPPPTTTSTATTATTMTRSKATATSGRGNSLIVRTLGERNSHVFGFVNRHRIRHGCCGEENIIKQAGWLAEECLLHRPKATQVRSPVRYPPCSRDGDYLPPI